MAGSFTARLPLRGAEVRLRLVEDSRLKFFTPEEIERQVDKTKFRALSKFGAFVRTTARSSLKYPGKKARARGDVSSPGNPPFVHRQSQGGGSPLKNLLLFAYDPSTESVVVGPKFFETHGESRPANGTVPGTLEHGGGVVRTVRVAPRTSGRRATPRQKETFLRKVKAGEIQRNKQTTRTVTGSIAPRPFMMPALEKEMPNFLPLFAGTFRKGAR